MKILVTGGAGYLGSILVPTLLGEGHYVTVLDNLMYRQSSLLGSCSNPQLEFVRGDCRDERIVHDLAQDKDCIIPLAALVGAPLCAQDSMAAWSVNFEAVHRLGKLVSASQRIIFPVTNSGYGVGEPGKYCTEDTPLRPISLYGETKVKAESVLLERENTITLRLATVFGASPRMRIDLLVNDFVYRAVHDKAVVIFEGHFKRNYIHVRDVSKVFVHAVDRFDDMKGQPYNVGLDDANLSKVELCEEIQKVIPTFVFFEAPIGEDPDKRDYLVSNARIWQSGFRPDWTIEMGIRELMKCFRMLGHGVHRNV
ncbi:MAG: NAD-dependent epimerase/dehydratase family protein [Nitrospirales bacterium]